MEKEYKIGKGWAISIYIFAPLLIAVFSWLLIMPFVSEDTPIEMSYFFVPTSIGMIGLMIFGLLDTIKGKVIISSDTLSTKNAFVNRDLKFKEIKGFQIERNYIFVYPKVKTKKKIKISTYIDDYHKIIIWLNSNFPNLNEVNIKKEKREILNNFDFGSNAKERSLQLNQAKKVARILNLFSILILVWTLFKQVFHKYAILTSISFLFIIIFVVIYYKGLIKFEDKEESNYPTIYLAVLITSCTIFLRALFTYNIFDHSNIWNLTIVITVILLSLVVLGTKEFKFKKVKEYFSLLSLSMFFFCFAYGTVITLNCMYDNSVPQEYHSKVLKKRIDSGKTTTYYLKLAAWNSQTENDEVSVSKELYDKLKTNNNVNIYLKKGRFNIPWFTVTK